MSVTSFHKVYWVREKNPSNKSALSLTSPLRIGKSSDSHNRNYETASSYIGDWLQNQKHGFGIQVYSNGSEYRGEWQYNKRHGIGDYFIKNKPKVQPIDPNITDKLLKKLALKKQIEESKESKENGSDLIKIYSGSWSEDTKSGNGIYYYNDNSRYEGQWINDKRNGNGILYYNNGDIYNGEWYNNKQNGFGSLIKSNGEIYEGQWLNGYREGSGLYYFKTKEKIYDAEWVQDEPKCGIYIDAINFFNDSQESKIYELSQSVNNITELQSTRFPITKSKIILPRLRLLQSDTILAKQIEIIQNSRAAARNLPTLDLESIYDIETIQAMKLVFDQSDIQHTGLIDIKELLTMVQNYNKNKLTVNREEIEIIKKDLNKNDTTHHTVDFREFVIANYLWQQMRYANNLNTNIVTSTNDNTQNKAEQS